MIANTGLMLDLFGLVLRLGLRLGLGLFFSWGRVNLGSYISNLNTWSNSLSLCFIAFVLHAGKIHIYSVGFWVGPYCLSIKVKC